MVCAWHGRLGDAGRANINLQRLHLLPPPHLSSLLFFVTRVAPNVGRGGDGNRGRSRLALGYEAAAGGVVRAAQLHGPTVPSSAILACWLVRPKLLHRLRLMPPVST